MHSYLVVVSESLRKEYLVCAKNETEARENYKEGDEQNCSTLEEFVVEVDMI